MRTQMIRYFHCLVFFCLCFSYLSYPAKAAPSELKATTIAGEKMSVPEKGKKTAVHFWTSWCPPCKDELPQFQKFYNVNKNHAQVITVNLTSQEQSKESVNRFLKEHQLTLPVVLDQDGKFMNLYRIVTIPTTYLYNEQGEIENIIVGPMTAEQLLNWSRGDNSINKHS